MAEIARIQPDTPQQKVRSCEILLSPGCQATSPNAVTLVRLGDQDLPERIGEERPADYTHRKVILRLTSQNSDIAKNRKILRGCCPHNPPQRKQRVWKVKSRLKINKPKHQNNSCYLYCCSWSYQKNLKTPSLTRRQLCTCFWISFLGSIPMSSRTYRS